MQMHGARSCKQLLDHLRWLLRPPHLPGVPWELQWVPPALLLLLLLLLLLSQHLPLCLRQPLLLLLLTHWHMLSWHLLQLRASLQ